MGSHCSIGMFLQKQFIFPDRALTPLRSTAFKMLAMSLMDSIFGANFANFALLVW